MLPRDTATTQQDGHPSLAGFPASTLLEPSSLPLASGADPLPRLNGLGSYAQPDGLFPFDDTPHDAFTRPSLLDSMPPMPYEGGGLFAHGGVPFGLELAPETFDTRADLMPSFGTPCKYAPCTAAHEGLQGFCPPLTPLAEYADDSAYSADTPGAGLDVNASEFHPRTRHRTHTPAGDTDDQTPPAGSHSTTERTPTTPLAPASVRRAPLQCSDDGINDSNDNDNDNDGASPRPQLLSPVRRYERRARSNFETSCTQSPPALRPKSRSSVSCVAVHGEAYGSPCYRHRQGMRRDELERLREQEPPEVKERRLAARQRQIDFGVDTEGYRNLCRLVPESKRSPLDPAIPNKCQNCSKRSWDGQIRKWRRLLHLYDNARTFEDVVAIRQQIERIQEEARECRRQGRSPASALPSPPSAVRRRECEKARRSKLRNELAQVDAQLAACEQELSSAPSSTLLAQRRDLAAQRNALAAQLKDLERAHNTSDARQQTNDGRSDGVERELCKTLGALCFDEE